jgi:hypothetical protein
MKITSFDEFKDLARRGTFVPVCKEIVADLLTPVSAFLKIAEHSDYAFLLESVEGGEHVGRYSFLGKDPFLILRGRDGDTSIEQAGVRTQRDEPVIDVLRTLMAEFQSPFVPDLPRFTGGAVGFLDYDAAEWFEPSVRLEKPALDRDKAVLESLLAWPWRILVNYDIVGSSWKDLEFVVESTPFTIDGHWALRRQIHMCKLRNGATILHICGVTARAEDTADFHGSVRVCRGN